MVPGPVRTPQVGSATSAVSSLLGPAWTSRRVGAWLCVLEPLTAKAAGGIRVSLGRARVSIRALVWHGSRHTGFCPWKCMCEGGTRPAVATHSAKCAYERLPPCGQEGVVSGSWLPGSWGSRRSHGDVRAAAASLTPGRGYSGATSGGVRPRPRRGRSGGPRTSAVPPHWFSPPASSPGPGAAPPTLRVTRILRQQQAEAPGCLCPTSQPLSPCGQFQLEFQQALGSSPAPAQGSFQKGPCDGGGRVLSPDSPSQSQAPQASAPWALGFLLRPPVSVPTHTPGGRPAAPFSLTRKLRSERFSTLVTGTEPQGAELAFEPRAVVS